MQQDVRTRNEQHPVAAMLTVDGVAALLACSPRTVYRLADRGQMPPPVRLGALVRWPRDVIDAWVADGCPHCRNRRS